MVKETKKATATKKDEAEAERGIKLADWYNVVLGFAAERADNTKASKYWETLFDEGKTPEEAFKVYWLELTGKDPFEVQPPVEADKQDTTQTQNATTFGEGKTEAIQEGLTSQKDATAQQLRAAHEGLNDPDKEKYEEYVAAVKLHVNDPGLDLSSFDETILAQFNAITHPKDTALLVIEEWQEGIDNSATAEAERLQSEYDHWLSNVKKSLVAEDARWSEIFDLPEVGNDMRRIQALHPTSADAVEKIKSEYEKQLKTPDAEEPEENKFNQEDFDAWWKDLLFIANKWGERLSNQSFYKARYVSGLSAEVVFKQDYPSHL